MRYGLLDAHAAGLHDIWGAGVPGVLALRSLAVLAVFGATLMALAVRVFTRMSVR